MITIEPTPPEPIDKEWNSPVRHFNRDISVIIPFHGKAFIEQLEFCVNVLKENNDLRNVDIIVVEEDSKPLAKSLCKKLEVRYHFIKSKERFCKSKCFNTGILQLAKYYYVMGLDCDMLTPPNFLIYGIKWLDHYDTIFLADDILYSDEYQVDNTFRWNGKSWKGNRHSKTMQGNFHGGCFFTKKDKFRECGGFYEEFVGYGSEDTEFYTRVFKVMPCWRAKKKGATLLHMKHDRSHAVGWEENRQRLLYLEITPMHDRVEEVIRSNTSINEKH